MAGSFRSAPFRKGFPFCFVCAENSASAFCLYTSAMGREINERGGGAPDSPEGRGRGGRPPRERTAQREEPRVLSPRARTEPPYCFFGEASESSPKGLRSQVFFDVLTKKQMIKTQAFQYKAQEKKKNWFQGVPDPPQYITHACLVLWKRVCAFLTLVGHPQ